MSDQVHCLKVARKVKWGRPQWAHRHCDQSAEANEPSDRLKLLVRRGARPPFDRVVELDDLLPNWGHRRAAAIRPSLRRGDCRVLQHIIYLLDREPCPPIGHAQIPRRRRNRSFGPNRFEECDFARSDSVAIEKAKTNENANICHVRDRPVSLN
jgi:hypothetical protein